MHICTMTALTTASSKAAWELLGETRLWHTWDQGLKQAQLISAFQQGSQGYLIRADSSTTTFTVLSCKTGVSYVISIALSHQVSLVVTRSVHATDEGTVVTQRTALGGSPVGQLKYTSQLRQLRNSASQQFDNILHLLQEKPILITDHRADPLVSPRY